MNKYRGQQGIALLIVLVALVFMTILAVRLSDHTIFSLKRAENNFAAPQIRWMLISAESVSLRRLKRWGQGAYHYVALNQSWAKGDMIHFRQGNVSSHIVSGQSCLNINVAGMFPEHDDGNIPIRNALRDVLISTGLNKKDANAAIKYFSSKLRAEKNTPFLDIYEIKQNDVLKKWQPRSAMNLLCVRPDTQSFVAINLLMPTDAQLLSLLSQNQLTVKQARDILEKRPVGGWKTMEEVGNALKSQSTMDQPTAQNMLNLLSIDNLHFVIDSTATYSGKKISMRSYVTLDRKSQQTSVWRRQIRIIK